MPGMDELNRNLWAPWRLAYIADGGANGSEQKSEKPGESKSTGEKPCFLCSYRESDEDSTNFVAHRSEFCLTVLNRYPYNNGHLLVAPKRHVGQIEELSPDELLDCQLVIQTMIRSLRTVINAQGFNVGLNLGAVAGAGLPGHLHWHIVPRWEGDQNFVAVTGNVHVIPQSLEALYSLLTRELSHE